jgi:hypothetical protein
MPYNPSIHAAIYIDKDYHKLLKLLAERQRRTLKATVEMLIESKIA